MPEYRTPPKVKLIIAVTFQNEQQLKDVIEYLTGEFGGIDRKTDIFTFDHTDYYEEEMGNGLFKVFLSFAELVDRGRLAEFKIISNRYEEETALEGKRTVNIDPGYIGEANLILASTKNFNHRVYLGNGIYGDCNMVFEEGEFRALPWTYADYKEEKHRGFFKEAREIYYSQLRSVKGDGEAGGVTYRDAGVDIDEGDRAIVRIKKMVKETFGPNVLTELGKFGGFYSLENTGFKEPVIVSSVDGVGTKLKVAFMSGVHNTVGQDLVNHCVNDILCCGARPLFFLDYLAFGKLVSDVFEDIVTGFAKACKEVGAALIGGETAEMPGIYSEGEYDISGTIVGLAEKSRILDGSKIRKGDVILGLPSTGLHTNGYSLARKILFDVGGYSTDSILPELEKTVGEELLQIHKCYFTEIYPLIEAEKISGLAHITGGGLTGNISRLLSEELEAVIEWDSWDWLPIFKVMQDIGKVTDEEMRHVFNLGIGIAIITDVQNAEIIKTGFEDTGQDVLQIGYIE